MAQPQLFAAATETTVSGIDRPALRGLMLQVAALAAAVTVAGPGLSASERARLSEAVGRVRAVLAPPVAPAPEPSMREAVRHAASTPTSGLVR